MFYDYTNEIVDLLTMTAVSVFILLSIFAILIPSYFRVIFVSSYLSNLIRWFVGLVIVFSLILIYNFFRNISPVIYSVHFFWEEGVDIEFRENNTFKARNSDMFSSSISYGNYIRENEVIILLDDIEFGISKMNDTLIITEEGIDFTLDSSGRVNEGSLIYVK